MATNIQSVTFDTISMKFEEAYPADVVPAKKKKTPTKKKDETGHVHPALSGWFPCSNVHAINYISPDMGALCSVPKTTNAEGVSGHKGPHSNSSWSPQGWYDPHHWVDASVGHPVYQPPSLPDTDSRGLHPRWNLAMMCADFYVLERLAYDSTVECSGLSDVLLGPHGDAWSRRYPRHFGRDNRADVFETVVVREWSSLRKKLAAEFSRYAPMICGGELRHAHGYNKKPTCALLQHHDKHGDYCASCGVPSGPIWGLPADEPIPSAWKKGKFTKTKTDGTHSMWFHEHTDECWADCQQKLGSHEHVSACFGNILKSISPSVVKFYKHATSSREGAWNQWIKFYDSAEDKAAVVKGLVESFEQPFWGSKDTSVGGLKWADIARAAYFYETREFSDVSFINQCWTLEHNGGCMFNKVYSVGPLKRVLQIQADGDYRQLQWWASPYVRGLFNGRLL